MDEAGISEPHKHALDLATATANRARWGQAQHVFFVMASNIAGTETAQKMQMEYMGRPSLIRVAAQSAIEAVKFGAAYRIGFGRHGFIVMIFAFSLKPHRIAMFAILIHTIPNQSVLCPRSK